uniref:uncharacterized protein LOC122601285 n=1 Tax=Erigeron canadensis TaxID=72917 RepID=UPI001CB8CFED|nr:uncharacterized protein LOC122601285 [Erigeron canadensis]
MVHWIMTCVATSSFLLSINGSLHGFFTGKRGLRQGDPLSPYLFTLVMEVLTLTLRRRIHESVDFTFHPKCEGLDILNLCFADDLLIFLLADVNSAIVIMETLEEFKNASGLAPSIPKSTAFFCNVLNHVKLSILTVLPFEEGTLLVKYLGVPLVSSRLVYRDCRGLIERATMFMLPEGVIKEIEQVLRNFLWSQGSLQKGKSKVAWDVVCFPKNEGGLGIRSLHDFNIALLSDRDGHFTEFTVANSWEAIRPRSAEVPCFFVVWFPSCIPRHAFHLWLVVKRKLRTQDLISSWDTNSNEPLLCSLCYQQSDSHNHLFFECSYASQVWRDVCGFMGIQQALIDWESILATIIPEPKKKTIDIIVLKLIFAATSYFIWQERNARLFKQEKRSAHKVTKIIIATVCLKFISMKFKKNSRVMKCLETWKIPLGMSNLA